LYGIWNDHYHNVQEESLVTSLSVVIH
jgi:hypothetical protein